MPLQKTLYREAFKMLCDCYEAEDAVQNLYLKLWERKEELKNLIAPEAYCRALLKNICIDRWRQIKARNEENRLQEIENTGYTPPEIESKEAEECMSHFLAGLPQQQQMVLKMRINGCTFEEIEATTGFSQVNIRVIISRIRKRFREFYNNT